MPKELRTGDQLYKDGFRINGNVNLEPTIVCNILWSVLLELPEKDYQNLKKKRIWFFLPHCRCAGFSRPVENYYKWFIYISPFMTYEPSEEYIRLLIAHEMSHVILEHRGGVDEEHEKEAWDKVKEMGFATDIQIKRFEKVSHRQICFDVGQHFIHKMLDFSSDELKYFKLWLKILFFIPILLLKIAYLSIGSLYLWHRKK